MHCTAKAPRMTHKPPHDPAIPERADGAPWRNFYGRRHGKTLRKSQVAHLETTLAPLRLANVDWDSNPDRNQLDMAGAFGREAPLVLEVGFGGGEHLAAIAQAHPDTNFIGCEPFVNGVAMLLAKIDAHSLTNIRIHPGDARDLLDVLPAAALSRAYLLYPDPWPKKRHHRRRFMNPEALDPLARALSPGADLRVATDIEDYVRHALLQVDRHPAFKWTAKSPQDWRAPWDGWVRTRYETKALREGRCAHYLRFERLA